MSIWPFGKRKTFLDPDDEDWHLSTWGWLMARFGRDHPRLVPLVTATREFFPPCDAAGHARAEYVFDCVRKLAGMGDWPCELIAQPKRPGKRVSEFGYIQTKSGALPLGTFSRHNNTARISYDPDSLDKPAVLVATLAHELSHYLLHSAPDHPPGGEAMEEFATDLTTAFLGFGLFGANQAFNFKQFGDSFSQGWQTSNIGYLRERDWAFALAVFCALRDQDIASLKPWLKPYLYTDVRNAARYLVKNPQVLAKIAERKSHYTASAT